MRVFRTTRYYVCWKMNRAIYGSAPTMDYQSLTFKKTSGRIFISQMVCKAINLVLTQPWRLKAVSSFLVVLRGLIFFIPVMFIAEASRRKYFFPAFVSTIARSRKMKHL